MQTATGTLLAAIQSKEQTPAVQVRADWRGDGTFSWDPGYYDSDVYSDTYGAAYADLGDLTPFVESWSVNRSLSTDLPEQAKVVEGFSAAEASVTLAGNPAGIDLCEAFAPYDNPLSAYSARIGAAFTIDAGFRTSAGTELLRQITGRVRNVSVDPDAGTVTLSVLDRRESVRNPVTLPTIAADDYGTVRPGLWAQFLMDYLGRANDFYASPPHRLQCFLSATLHGSAWAEVGTLTAASTLTAGSGARGQCQFTPHPGGGTVGMGTSTAFVPQASYAVAAGLNTNNGSNLYVEAVVTAGALAPMTIAVHDGTTNWRVTVSINLAGSISVVSNRNGVSTGVVVVALAPLSNAAIAHSLGVHIAFTAAGCTINANCDGTTGTATGVVANPTGSPSLTVVDVSPGVSGGVLSAVQVTNEPYSAGMFNDDFVPTAVFERPFNNLTATPPTDTSDPWELLQQLAAAEQGTIGFDENGVLRFNNREHMTGGAAVATVTTDPAVSFANMLRRASTEAIDSVRNHVAVPAQPYTVDPPGTTIWVGTEVLGVIAGQSLVVPLEFEGTVYALASVSYLAAQNADGTGGDVSNLTVTAVRVTATTYTLTVTNPNAFDVFLVANSTAPATAGDPALSVVGQLIRAGDTYNSIRQDTASQARYGRQSLDVSGTVWMQSAAAADALSAALLGMLAAPSPTLENVETVADPRLQLGDRVRVVDADGLALDHDFWATGIQSQGSTPGYAQTLVLRQA